jgi:adenylylsulfate kinase
MNIKAFAIWFTGLSGAGKTTLCRAVASRLSVQGISAQILDGDEIRENLCSDLGFSMEDRCENIRRIVFVADLLVCSGVVALVATISPLRRMREVARDRIDRLIEVFVEAPLSVCEARDPKGLYSKARAGKLPGFTGIESVYEPPVAPDVICRTNEESVNECANKILECAMGYGVTELRPHDLMPDLHMHSSRTIAVDFDGVIADYAGWRGRNVLGSPRSDVVQALRDLKAEGWMVIVHTTRYKHDILEYLRSNSIPYDDINKSGSNCVVGCKPRANVYWDDRALKYSGNARNDIDLIRNFCTWNGRS